MEGHYETSTTADGKSTLEIKGKLNSPMPLSKDDSHYAIWVLGGDENKQPAIVNSEWFWCGWEPNSLDSRNENIFTIGYHEP